MKMQNKLKEIRIILIALFLLLAFQIAFIETVFADLLINLVAVNPKEDESKEMEVKYFLPEELSPEDIVDTGVLKVDYDVDEQGYFVYGLINFKPKESKTFKIKVKDVWQIKQDEIDLLKGQLDENLKLLEGQENYGKAKTAKDRVDEQLDTIMAQQANYSENVGRRIEQFRAYKEMLNKIRDNIYDFDSLEHMAENIEELDRDKTVKFVVEVNNPSENEDKTVQQKHYLPKEVRQEDVLENQGFDVRFDEDKQMPYLAKEETFEPGETKRYEFVIVDVWYLAPSQINSLEERAKIAMAEIEGSIYEPSGKFLYDSISENVQDIRLSQNKEMTIKEHIGIYRVNVGRLDEAEEDLERIEKMMAIVKAQKLEELESSKVENVLQRLQALRGIQAISDALFKKGISVTMTWRVVFGTIIFVAAFTAIHFFFWIRRAGRFGEERGLKEGEEIIPVPKPGTEEAEDYQSPEPS